jgi:hypothetical protein
VLPLLLPLGLLLSLLLAGEVGVVLLEGSAVTVLLGCGLGMMLSGTNTTEDGLLLLLSD